MKRMMHWSLVGTLMVANISVADMPLKGGKPVFGTPQAPVTSSMPPRTVANDKPIAADKKVIQASLEKSQDAVPTVPPPVMMVDHSVKAASIEVAWLQQPLTYPLRLRAECKPGEEAITITGYLPHDRMREKVLAIARTQAGSIPLVDQMMVQPMMVLPNEVPVDGEQAFLVKVALERVSAGLSTGLDLSVDAQGIVTVTGRVDDLMDRRKIIRGLQGIPGCTAVKYNLSVAAPTRQSLVTVVPSITLAPVTQVEAKVESKKVEGKSNPVVKPPVVLVPPLDLRLPGEKEVAPPPPPRLALPQEESKPLPEPTVEKMIVSSTQSGLFPPGVTGLSPVLDASSITLGTPVLNRSVVTSPMIVQVEAVEPAPRVHVTRPITLSVTSQSTVEAVPVEVEPTPMLIPVMPRRANTAPQRRVIP